MIHVQIQVRILPPLLSPRSRKTKSKNKDSYDIYSSTELVQQFLLPVSDSSIRLKKLRKSILKTHQKLYKADDCLDIKCFRDSRNSDLLESFRIGDVLRDDGVLQVIVSEGNIYDKLPSFLERKRGRSKEVKGESNSDSFISNHRAPFKKVKVSKDQNQNIIENHEMQSKTISDDDIQSKTKVKNEENMEMQESVKKETEAFDLKSEKDESSVIENQELEVETNATLTIGAKTEITPFESESFEVNMPEDESESESDGESESKSDSENHTEIVSEVEGEIQSEIEIEKEIETKSECESQVESDKRQSGSSSSESSESSVLSESSESSNLSSDSSDLSSDSSDSESDSNSSANSSTNEAVSSQKDSMVDFLPYATESSNPLPSRQIEIKNVKNTILSDSDSSSSDSEDFDDDYSSNLFRGPAGSQDIGLSSHQDGKDPSFSSYQANLSSQSFLIDSPIPIQPPVMSSNPVPRRKRSDRIKNNLAMAYKKHSSQILSKEEEILENFDLKTLTLLKKQ